MTLFCYKPACLSCANRGILMLTSREHDHLHMKNNKVCNKTRSLPASLPFKGQGNEHTTVKWPIARVTNTVIKDKHFELLPLQGLSIHNEALLI